ncbi:D-TA family PLP-dependent enzyme [Euzebyella marina]|uniref:D-TA family PLP-dependent enzyme n=1 Tax=Euzebyella marina TaxID=1761453 RepID=A0A3G2LAZ3_9FLAO|nr:D-TA family PLP-dependent enzyme [Euzebyella marina]AYN69371.1 D-TA family PLP-dependent enzyme [Euzebyella marina]
MSNLPWYALQNPEKVISPALLVYPDRIQQNIDTMLNMSDDSEFLRPHVKTHKTAEIIQMQLKSGISKFKCATIAEAELLAQNGTKDVLLAMQPVGNNIDRFVALMQAFPSTVFSALFDDQNNLNTIASKAKKSDITVRLWLDINNGMNRTGIAPHEKALQLYQAAFESPNVEIMGLHVYDGHLRNTDPSQRKVDCDKAFQSVVDFSNQIQSQGMPVPHIVAGGSPSYPFHCKRKGVEASPGTTLLWDAGYGGLFPEMDFKSSAVLLTRIISKPNENTICLDLGHKWLASEMNFPRVKFLNVKNWKQLGQSEEHFVIETENAKDFEIGDVIYCIPMHICPTVAKQHHLQVVKNNEVTNTWLVAARNQSINL